MTDITSVHLSRVSVLNGRLRRLGDFKLIALFQWSRGLPA